MLVKNGHQIDVFTTTANGKEELPKAKEVDVEGVRVFYFRRITKDHTHFSPSLLFNLWKRVKEYDAIHIHS